MNSIKEIIKTREQIIKNNKPIEIKKDYIIENLLLFDYPEYFDKRYLELFVENLIFCANNDKIVEKILPQLFELLQDVNWPGSMKAINFIKDVNPDIYVDELNKTLKKAIEIEDEDWIFGINYLIDKVESLSIKNNTIIKN